MSQSEIVISEYESLTPTEDRRHLRVGVMLSATRRVGNELEVHQVGPFDKAPTGRAREVAERMLRGMFE